MGKYIEYLLDKIYQCDPYDTWNKIILFSIPGIFVITSFLVWLNC